MSRQRFFRLVLRIAAPDRRDELLGVLLDVTDTKPRVAVLRETGPLLLFAWSTRLRRVPTATPWRPSGAVAAVVLATLLAVVAAHGLVGGLDRRSPTQALGVLVLVAVVLGSRRWPAVLAWAAVISGAGLVLPRLDPASWGARPVYVETSYDGYSVLTPASPYAAQVRDLVLLAAGVVLAALLSRRSAVADGVAAVGRRSLLVAFLVGSTVAAVVTLSGPGPYLQLVPGISATLPPEAFPPLTAAAALAQAVLRGRMLLRGGLLVLLRGRG